MKKILFLIFAFALFSGCADTQNAIDKYIEKREIIVKTAKVLNDEALCVKRCNADFDAGSDRADCKVNCIEL